MTADKKRGLNLLKWIRRETVNFSFLYLLSILLSALLFSVFRVSFRLPDKTGTLIVYGLVFLFVFFLSKFWVFRTGKQGWLREVPLSLILLGLNAVFSPLMTLLLHNVFSIQKTWAVFISGLLCFFFNVYASCRWIFPKANRRNTDFMSPVQRDGILLTFFKRNRFVCFSFLIAALVMAFAYYCYGALFFGDVTILRMDLYHQYGPLFGELYDRILEGGSFLYSWESGMGSSFLGNFFNYLSSPLNFLVLLFRRENITDAIGVIVLLKAALSAGIFTYYLKKHFHQQNFITAGFGILYAFSAYFLAYYWNVMWLDAMVLLPLLLFGIEQIVARKNSWLYFGTLCFIMVSNYYMSFILCIFSVFYFLAVYFTRYNLSDLLETRDLPSKHRWLHSLKNSRFIATGLHFAGASLLAAACCAATLLPTYFALQATSATSGTFPETYEKYFSFFDLISAHLPALETTIRSSGGNVLPNIYCGTIILILIPLYLLCKSISLRKKVIHVVLLILFALSFNINFLNYIWHGLHFPNDLPYRFSFIYSFLILVMAFEVLQHIREFSYKEIMGVGILVVGFILLAEKMPTKYIDDMTVYVSLAFAMIYTLLLIVIRSKKYQALAMSVLLFAAFTAETIIASTDSYDMGQNKKDYAGDYTDYKQTLTRLKTADSGFYRVELSNLRTRMDPCWYGYPGISTFSSMAYENFSGLQYSLGMFGNRINSYTYNPQTPVYNSMMGLKYLIHNHRNQDFSDSFYTEKWHQNAGNLTVYENNYALPIAYGVNGTIKEWNPVEGDPFVVQSEFFENATGIKNVFRPAEYEPYFDCSNMDDAGIPENGTFGFSKQVSGTEGSVTFHLKITQNENYYLYVSSDFAQNLEVTCGDQSIVQEIGEPYILDLGKYKIGDIVDVQISSSADQEAGSISIYAYSLNQKAFEQGYRKLKDSGLKISSYSDTKIQGRITQAEEGVLLASIPFDEGWSVSIDGEKAEIFEVGGAMIGVNLPAGTHTVTYQYQPKGLKAGAGISVCGIAGTIVFIVLERKKRKKNAILNSSGLC